MESVQFDSVSMKNYERRAQISDLREVLSLPVSVPESNLFLVCRKNADKMVVGMWNVGLDIVLPQETM